MRARVGWHIVPRIWVLAVTAFGCRAPLEPEPRPSADLSWTVEPGQDPEQAPSVCRVRVRDAASWPEPSELGWFSGELSAYHLGRIHDRDLPNTLLERSVPLLTWSDGDDLVLAPTLALTPGEIYSLAAPELGLLGTLRVVQGGGPALARVWPPPGLAGGRALGTWCGPLGALGPETTAELEPGRIPARLRVLEERDVATGERCVTVQPLAELPSDPLLAVPAEPTLLLQPEPLVPAFVPETVGLVCTELESTVGPGCLRVLDDRAVLRSAGATLRWTFGGGLPPELRVLEPGGRAVLRGLTPDAGQMLEVGWADLADRASSTTLQIWTLAAQSHVAINEVLANPLGAEPAQEWVELVNHGSIAVELGGHRLADAAGEVILPEHLLGAGELVVIARDDFAPDAGADVPVAPGVAVLRVATLGKNGLSNSGERIELSTEDGVVLSSFPAAPKPKSGVSVARREPWALDDDPTSFALHADPGASPGLPNLVDPK